MGDSVIIRDTCVCGKRYRIRHPNPGFTFQCPACRRQITITEADILLAPPDIHEGPRIQEQEPGGDELLEAIPVGEGVLRPAAHGSKKGAAFKVAYDNEDAMVANAIAGRPLVDESSDDGAYAPPIVDKAQARRSFLGDLFSSFYFAGYKRNMVSFAATAAGIAIIWILLKVVPFPLNLLFLLLGVFAVMGTIVFFWRTIGLTARGEDEIPLIESDWDWWTDVLRPALWMLYIYALCGAPAVIVFQFVPASYAPKPALVLLALTFGSLFWPVAVMSVAIGESIVYLRPDLLVRCIAGIGPIYVVPWIMTMVMLCGWVLAFEVRIPITFTVSVPWYVAVLVQDVAFPLIWTAINLYFGYVVFRTLGLLFRHFRTRLPWKF